MKAIFTTLFSFCLVTCCLAQKKADSISITADHVSVNEKTGITTYRGNVSYKSENNDIVNADKIVFDKRKNKITAYSGNNQLKGKHKVATIKH